MFLHLSLKLPKCCFSWGLPWWLRQERIRLQCWRLGFDPWVGKIPCRRAWQPTPAFLPGESPWTEGPGGLQSIASQRIRPDWVTKHSSFLWVYHIIYVHPNVIWQNVFIAWPDVWISRPLNCKLLKDRNYSIFPPSLHFKHNVWKRVAQYYSWDWKTGLLP